VGLAAPSSITCDRNSKTVAARGDGSAMTAPLTFFTTCKPFEGNFSVIQWNALRSWKIAYPGCDVIIFGDEPGVSECCRELGFKQISRIRRSEYGTPLLDSLFEEVEHATTTDILVFINADIMLTQGLISAVQSAGRHFEKFLLIARRWNVELETAWNFASPEWEARLQQFAREQGSLEPPYGGIDLFAYSRGIWGSLPPFAVGRTRWDSALIYQARRRKVPVIDATEILPVIHQNHDYSHSANGVMGIFKGPEAITNQTLLGGEEFILTPLNATHRLTKAGICSNRVFYPPYLLRKLATLPALYTSLAPVAPLVKWLAPCWRRLHRLKEKLRSKPGEKPVSRQADAIAQIPYPVSTSADPKYPPTVPPGGGVENFDTPAALELNRARLTHLASLDLPLQGKRVLDVGCGVGHLAQFFVQKGCDVLCVDGRKENLERLKDLYPSLRAESLDLEKDDILRLGRFDVVFAYGLLYHLENPFGALRSLASVCSELLLLETVIADHRLPLVRFAEETRAYSQALRNVGSRPTPSFIVLALRSAGFRYIYAPKIPPDHRDFNFPWQDDLSDSRDGHLLRCIFVAARRMLENAALVSLLKNRAD
jgi:2-polyprenyl-3-methyl-5-hydroxy-6-metoxy-1,4-benzoquinol methylase